MNYEDYVSVAQKILDTLDLDISPANLTAFKGCLKNVFPFEKNHKRLTYKLADYPNRVAEARKKHTDINYDVMDELLLKCKMLLLEYKDKPNEYESPFVLAVVEYFLTDADAVPDFESPDGFSDDKQIIDAIIEQFDLIDAIEGSGIMLDTERSVSGGSHFKK